MLALLIALASFTSCGGKGGSTTTNTPPVATTYAITATAGSNGSVTPSGATTVTQGASQSYTITPDSGYAAATLVVDGTTVATSSTYTFSNVQASHTISATFSAAPAGGIALSLVPARSSGVAPLAVFFDASGTTDVGVTSRPFHDLNYTWDFGDPTAGTWAYGAQPGVSSKNSATGPVAAHVFEKPGTYTVSVTAFDGTSTATISKTITVDDPEAIFAGSSTVCVSTSGDFAGCPSGATKVTTSSFTTALSNISSTVKRILFRAGETWTASSAYTLTQAGPGLIGSFGTGAKPFVQVTGNSHSAILFQSNDWRAVDLKFDGIGTSASSVTTNFGKAQITILRFDVTNIDNGYGTGNSTIPNTDQYTVQDSTFAGINGENGQGYVAAWVYGERFAFQGNHLDNTRPATGVIGGEHVLRFPKVTKGVISNNDAWNPNASKHCLKLHSANRVNALIWDGTYTEQVVIADNNFKGNTGVPWDVAIMSQNGPSDERLRNIIFERNYLANPANSYLLSLGDTVGGTVRNNIFQMGTFSVGMNIAGDVGNASPPADLINVYNNTFYGTHVSDSNNIHAVVIGATPLTSTVRNNLLSAPNNSAATMTWMTGTTLIADHNLINNTPSALWVSGTPAVPADFRLKSGSPAIGAGAAIPVWDDFVRAARSSSWDVGAYAH